LAEYIIHQDITSLFEQQQQQHMEEIKADAISEVCIESNFK
jgi:hypothetical protein